MAHSIYNTSLWRTTSSRAIARDGHRCTVSRLLGGQCSLDRPLHAHHIHAVSEGGAPYDIDNVGTVCAAHHPMWEALRRTLVARLTAKPVRCRHEHRTPESRAICERRMARQRQLAA